jgi:hypothetical protein
MGKLRRDLLSYRRTNIQRGEIEGKRLPVPVGVPEVPLDWSFRLAFRYTLRYKPSTPSGKLTFHLFAALADSSATYCGSGSTPV